MRSEHQTWIETLSRHATPLLVYPREDSAIDGCLTGGTGVLVQTPVNRLLITANHVANEIERIRDEHIIHGQHIVTLLCGTNASPHEISGWQIVDRDKRLDVCIFQVPETFDPDEINKSFYLTDFAVTRPAVEDDEVLIIGFPKEHRAGTGSVINARMLPIVDFVKSVSETRFVVADPDNQRQIVANPVGLDFPDHMGGASGAPAFRLSPAGTCELIGIFIEGSDGLNGAYFCTHIRFFTNRGTIDSLLMPPY